MHLPTYLSRLGLQEPPPPTLAALRLLHVAHLAAFPFHNLTIQRRGVVDVRVTSIEERFYCPGGGGYCFEQNTLLGAALRELGFRVTTLMGRVGAPDESALNHMLLRVEIDGEPWLADVGFGAEGPLEPIPMREGRVTQDGIDFSLRHDDPHWTLAMHYGGKDEDLYSFTAAPHTAADVAMANYWMSTHPASSFRPTITIQRITPEERLILRPRVITRYRNGVRTDIPIDPSEVRRVARELFGIELEEAPLLFEELSPQR